MCFDKAARREYLYTIAGVKRTGNEWGFLLPAALFAVLEEGAVAVDLARPAALHTAAVAPIDVRDEVGVRRIPLVCGGYEGICRAVGVGSVRGGGRLPDEFGERAGEALEIFLAFIFGHDACQGPSDGNHAGGVCADEQGPGSGRIGVQTLDEFIQAVCDAVVELGYALAFGGGNDDRVLLWSKVLGKVLCEHIVGCWRRVVEACEAIEFSKSGFKVDRRLANIGIVATQGSPGRGVW